MKNPKQSSDTENNNGRYPERVDSYFHPAPFVLTRPELFTGLAFAFGIGLGIGGLIIAIVFHL